MRASWREIRDPDRAAVYLRSAVLNQARSRLRRAKVAADHAGDETSTPAACHPDYEKPRQYLAIDPDTGESAPFAAPGDFVSIDFDTTGRYLL